MILLLVFILWAYLYIRLTFSTFIAVFQSKSLTTSIKMIKIFHKPFYCDSKAFASRFWLTMCSPAGYIYIISFLTVQPLISLVFLDIFYCSNFQMTCERSYNWNALLISSPACSWFGFNKKLRFTAGVTSEKLQSRPIMTKLDPTQPGHMHSTMIWNGKIKK